MKNSKRCKLIATCELTHCMCGTHDEEHECEFREPTELDEQVAAAELAAGWSSEP